MYKNDVGYTQGESKRTMKGESLVCSSWKRKGNTKRENHYSLEISEYHFTKFTLTKETKQILQPEKKKKKEVT